MLNKVIPNKNIFNYLNNIVFYKTMSMFVFMILGLSWLAGTDFFTELIIQPFSTHITYIVYLFVDLFINHAQLYNNILVADHFGIHIIPACTGFPVAIILVSVTLAFPASYKTKILIIFISLFALHLYNIIRLISLFIFGYFYPQWFDVIHRFVGQPLTILFILFCWVYLSQKLIPARIAGLEQNRN